MSEVLSSHLKVGQAQPEDGGDEALVPIVVLVFVLVMILVFVLYRFLHLYCSAQTKISQASGGIILRCCCSAVFGCHTNKNKLKIYRGGFVSSEVPGKVFAYNKPTRAFKCKTTFNTFFFIFIRMLAFQVLHL